jgi:VWFA-related protein
MNRFAALALAVALAFAQNPSPPVNQPPTAAIRIDVNLVQVDTVVTDSRNRRVTDLTAADFELLQDGKPQTITNFSYVTHPAPPAPAPRATASAAAKPAKGDVPPPPITVEPAAVHRTLALVVDDLGLAGDNIAPVRNAIRKFVDEDMRPDDLVAIVRTGAGMGALQQFTTDKRLLHEALDHVKYGDGRVGMGSFTPLGSGPRGRGAAQQVAANHFRDDALSVGSLGAIRYVVNEMAGFPGRKSVVLFTENIELVFRGTTDEMVQQAVQQLSDAANRAAVAIHAVDPRGIADFNVNAQDNTGRMSARRVSRVPAQREQQMETSQQGMFALSEATGGLFMQGVNDLSGELRKAADDSDGYYLLGYHPDATTFDDNGTSKYHRLQVRVKKSGLHVRSRDGFFGQPGGAAQTELHTRDAELNGALQSPYAGAIHPRMTAVFSNTAKSGTFISALVHFETSDLKWSDEADGGHKSTIDLAAATFDENGLALAAVNSTFPLTLNAKEYGAAVKNGLVYSLYVPIAKPGPYLVRAALRDPATENTGSAEKFVEVPDVAAGHLALSGVVMQDATTQASVEMPHGPAPRVDMTGGTARRVFRRGMPVTYSYEILNVNASTGQKPDVDVECRLFHDGAQVVTNKVALEIPADTPDPHRLIGAGRLSVGTNLPLGEYVLQVIVTDKAAKNKLNVVEQSMDFEVVE